MSAPAPRDVLRKGARRLMALVPPDRRAKGLGGARGRRVLQLRKLVAPVLQRPVVLTAASGARLRITADPVDEQIAHHLLGSSRGDYFPDWPGRRPAAPFILDIGAHHGLYAVCALREYPGSRIVCVEPSRDAIDALRANLALNGCTGRARIVAAALAPADGSAELRHTSDGTWGFSLYEDAADAIGGETVRLETLDAILAGETPDIVKCNAEGAEYTLVEQLAARPERPALMTIMVHPAFGDMDALLATARSMGYEVTPVGTDDRPAFRMWHVAARDAS